jgi:hypothetical protein
MSKKAILGNLMGKIGRSRGDCLGVFWGKLKVNYLQAKWYDIVGKFGKILEGASRGCREVGREGFEALRDFKEGGKKLEPVGGEGEGEG